MKFSTPVLVSFSVTIINTTTRSNLEREGCILTYKLRVHHPGKPKTETRGRGWSREHGLWLTGQLPLVFSDSFLIPPWTTCPQMLLPKACSDLLYQLATKKMVHRHTHRPVWWQHFQGDSSLRHVDTPRLKTRGQHVSGLSLTP